MTQKSFGVNLLAVYTILFITNNPAARANRESLVNDTFPEETVIDSYVNDLLTKLNFYLNRKHKTMVSNVYI